MTKQLNVAIIGNPNTGKTTLYNTLCNQQCKTANWSGVTVSRHTTSHQKITWTDLPGCYSLHNHHNKNQPDYRDTQREIESNNIDLYVQVVTSHQLPRQLYLTLQLLELGKPLLIAINHFSATHPVSDTLSSIFDIPCVDLNALKDESAQQLRQAIEQHPPQKSRRPFLKHIPSDLKNQLADHPNGQNQLSAVHTLVTSTRHEIPMAEARYQFINQQPLPKVNALSKLDRWLVAHPLSWAVFIVAIFMVFHSATLFNRVIEPPLTLAAESIFIHGLFYLFSRLDMPSVVTTIAVYGFGQGVTTIVSLLPIIFGMFCGLFYLEESGYLARVSVLMDRQLKQLGLPGSASISLFLGFGCNVGAVLSTRHMKSQQQRIVAISMIPFMSCSARLSIFAVFSTLLFPSYSSLIITTLYATGIAVAFLTAYLVSRSLKLPSRTSLAIDLVPMRQPKIRIVLIKSLKKIRAFIRDAGGLIVLFCIGLSIVNNIDIHGQVIHSAQQTSILAFISKPIASLFIPIGLSPDNWPATAALFTGLLAKEVVIGTLTSLYAQSYSMHTDLAAESFSFFGQLGDALHALSDNLVQLFSYNQTAPFIEPIIQQHLPAHFTDPVATFCYMLFILLYFPCISTFSVISSEIGKRWAYLSVAWSLLVAYVLSATIYQSYQHPDIPLAIGLLWIAYQISQSILYPHALLD